MTAQGGLERSLGLWAIVGLGPWAHYPTVPVPGRLGGAAGLPAAAAGQRPDRAALPRLPVSVRAGLDLGRAVRRSRDRPECVEPQLRLKGELHPGRVGSRHDHRVHRVGRYAAVPRHGQRHRTQHPHPVPLRRGLLAVLTGATVGCFSFIGFDPITMYAEEARNKFDISKAIIITLLIGGGIFLIAGQVAQLVFPNVATSA